MMTSISVAVVGCTVVKQTATQPTNTGVTNNTNQLVGNDKDVHGCSADEGTWWCEKLQRCIRAVEMPCPVDEPKVVLDPRYNTCNENSKYFVLSNSYLGSFIVKYKTTPDQKISCIYSVTNPDFEIKGLEATYFLALTDNFLILDQGTAPPPRGLLVYDLRSRKQVYSDTYADFAIPTTTNGDTITYWDPTNEKPTSKNCSSLNEYTADGLGVVIESQVSLDLNSLSKKDLGEYRCSPTQ